ncbi:hypothetical protein [Dyella sp.]|uniref:hypothetical protein n=1 Tax=Dyella sp. TaxID=1869338 RepID=UPI002ED2A9BF
MSLNWFFLYALFVGSALPFALGWPIAILLGFRQGVRSVGMGLAIGLSLVLLICRAAQILVPMTSAAYWLLAACVGAGLALWFCRQVRIQAKNLLMAEAWRLAMAAALALLLIVVINLPMLQNVVTFDGSRNTDSIYFTINARYMLGHAFDGAADFDPAHPAFYLARMYFGQGAIEPRVGSEGFLALLSAWAGRDPIYLYNGLQAAGLIASLLSLLIFVPPEAEPVRRRDWLMLLALAFICPTLLFVAINSNFPNLMTLPAAAGYVGLFMMPRRRTFLLAAVLLIGGLMSTYPELLLFVGFMRGLAILASIRLWGVRGCMVAWAWMLLEIGLACCLFPWAAAGSWHAFVAAHDLSHADASERDGNMYAGVAMALAAAAILVLSWRVLSRHLVGKVIQAMQTAILVAYGLALAAMVVRNFPYGGFKLSQYFIAPILGGMLACAAVVLVECQSQHWSRKWRHPALLACVAVLAVMVLRDGRLIRRDWEFSADRRVTYDLMAMASAVEKRLPDSVVMLGETPADFYYGHWVPYILDAQVILDLSHREAGGQLRPYLQLQQEANPRKADAMLSIGGKASCDGLGAIRHGAVCLQTRQSCHGVDWAGNMQAINQTDKLHVDRPECDRNWPRSP